MNSLPIDLFLMISTKLESPTYERLLGHLVSGILYLISMAIGNLGNTTTTPYLIKS